MFVFLIWHTFYKLSLRSSPDASVCFFLGAFAKFRKPTVNFVMSVCLCLSVFLSVCLSLCLSVCLSVCPSVRPSAWNNSAPTGRIFIKFHISVFFNNLSRKCKFHQNLTIQTGTSHEDLCIFMITSRCVLFRTRRCIENQNTHLCSITFSRKSYRLWDNVEKYVRSGQAKMTI
jgi:hypothetical protein